MRRGPSQSRPQENTTITHNKSRELESRGVIEFRDGRWEFAAGVEIAETPQAPRRGSLMSAYEQFVKARVGLGSEPAEKDEPMEPAEEAA